MKKDIIKKITTAILVSGVMIGAFATNGFATNNSDHYWQLYQVLGDKGWHYIDELRYKEDASAAYVQITGTRNKNDGEYVNMKVVSASHDSLMGSLPAKTAYGEGQYSIHSYAYEMKGHSQVTIGFWAPYRTFSSWSAWGNWSPDSSGSYD